MKILYRFKVYGGGELSPSSPWTIDITVKTREKNEVS